MNKVIESPIRKVSALTVLLPPVLSFAKKKSAENRLATMVMSAKTMITFINMAMSKTIFE